MRGMWLFCLCTLLLAQPPELLVIDNFESEETWTPAAAEGCTINVFLDRLNVKEGQASLRLEAVLAGPCEDEKCYAGVTHDVPDLSGYAFLRLWIRADAASNAYFGIYLESSKGGYFHVVPLDNTRWNLMNVSFSQFKSEEQLGPVNPEDVKSIALILGASEPATVKLNVDGLVALTDLNGNGIADIDETQKREAAKNTEEIANRYFDEGDYGKAEKYYQEARSLYQQLDDQEKAKEMDLRARESRAWLDYEQAEQFFEQKEYTKAMDAYERARKGFVLLNNLEMVDTIENRLEELSALAGRPVTPLSDRPLYEQLQKRKDAQRGGAGGLLFIIIVVILVGVGVYLWKFRGAPEAETGKEKLISPSGGKSEEIRKLKAKFVYGEINRKEYEKRLRELEES